MGSTRGQHVGSRLVWVLNYSAIYALNALSTLELARGCPCRGAGILKVSSVVVIRDLQSLGKVKKKGQTANSFYINSSYMSSCIRRRGKCTIHSTSPLRAPFFSEQLKKKFWTALNIFILYFNLILFLEKRCPKMNVETNSNGSPVWHGLDVGPILNLVLPRMNFLDVLITSKLWNIHFLSKGPFANDFAVFDQPTNLVSTYYKC